MLLRTLWLSLDPYRRGRMSDVPSYAKSGFYGAETKSLETASEIQLTDQRDKMRGIGTITAGICARRNGVQGVGLHGSNLEPLSAI